MSLLAEFCVERPVYTQCSVFEIATATALPDATRKSRDDRWLAHARCDDGHLFPGAQRRRLGGTFDGCTVDRSRCLSDSYE